jgi:hypothetical protein
MGICVCDFVRLLPRNSRGNSQLLQQRRILQEELLRLVKKFPEFHETRRFIFVFTISGHSCFFPVTPTNFTIPHPISLQYLCNYTRIYSYALQVVPSHRCPYQKSPISMYLLLHTCHVPRPSHSSLFDHPNNIW